MVRPRTSSTRSKKLVEIALSLAYLQEKPAGSLAVPNRLLLRDQLLAGPLVRNGNAMMAHFAGSADDHDYQPKRSRIPDACALGPPAKTRSERYHFSAPSFALLTVEG